MCFHRYIDTKAPSQGERDSHEYLANRQSVHDLDISLAMARHLAVCIERR